MVGWSSTAAGIRGTDGKVVVGMWALHGAVNAMSLPSLGSYGDRHGRLPILRVCMFGYLTYLVAILHRLWSASTSVALLAGAFVTILVLFFIRL